MTNKQRFQINEKMWEEIIEEMQKTGEKYTSAEVANIGKKFGYMASTKECAGVLGYANNHRADSDILNTEDGYQTRNGLSSRYDSTDFYEWYFQKGSRYKVLNKKIKSLHRGSVRVEQKYALLDENGEPDMEHIITVNDIRATWSIQ